MFGDFSISLFIMLVLMVFVRSAARRIMSMKKNPFTQSGFEPENFRLVSQCLNWLRYPACTPSHFVFALHVQSSKGNHGLSTGFQLLFTMFCDVYYIQFVPTVLLDLSCCRLKSFAAFRVSLEKSCLLIQGRCIYTEGPRTHHTAHFSYKSITHRESKCEQRSERCVIIQSCWSEGVRL